MLRRLRATFLQLQLKTPTLGTFALLLAFQASAAYETLIDFTTFTKGVEYSLGTGAYAAKYSAEQCLTSEDGVTVYSDPGKQENPEVGWFTMNIRPVVGATADWFERDFELVLSGSPQGRDGNNIAINLTDATGETYQYYPSRQYMEDGDLHLVYRNSHGRPASGYWGGDNDGKIRPPMSFTAVNMHFTGIAGTIGVVTFKKVVSLDDGDIGRNIDIVEPISLDTTYPGAAPFTGPYRLDFKANGSYTGGVWLYLYEESDHYVTFGKATNFYQKMSSDSITFNVNLDPSRHYHYYKLDISSSRSAVSGIGYFKQTEAEAMRLDVDTKNELHICRDESERPTLVIRNPSATNLHWKTEIVVSDTFERSFRIPFDRTVGPGETVRIDLPWPLPAMGVWYVNARVTGDDGSMAVKTTQFAWIPRHEVTPRMDRSKFRFGIHNHGTRYMPNETDKFISALVAAGAKFTRTDYSFMFSDVCPSRSVYESGADKWSWEKPDILLDKLVTAGLSTEIIIYSAPGWAQDPTATWNQSDAGRNATRSGCRPMIPGVFRNFCEQFGRRYSGKIDYYEVGNEWDIVPRVTLSPAEALRMQREAYEGLHAGDPHACVCPNGWAGVGVSHGESNYNDPNYNWGLSEAISDNPDCFDNWLIHLHSTFESYSSQIDTYLIPLLRDKLKGTKPWVSGESAITSAYGNEYNQGLHVWYKTLFAWNRGARDYIWYNLKATGWFDGGEPGFGLVTADYHPRAGYAAFAALTDIFEGLDADGTVHETDKRKLFRYRGKNQKGTIDGIVLAGWDRGIEQEWTMQIATDAKRAELSDHMGNRTEAEIRDGVVLFRGAFAPRALILQGATYARLANSCMSDKPVAAEFTGRHWYVDGENRQRGDGSAANPFSTIQSAVAVASDLDVIEIAAGEYSSGSVEDGVFGRSRIVIDRKLHLIGAGRGKTVIRGGSKVRCLLVRESAAGSLIEGVSFLDGETTPYDETRFVASKSQSNIRCKVGGSVRRLVREGGNLAACGGGIYYLASNRLDLVYLVDCRVGHCRAGFAGGAIYGPVSLIRTLIDNSSADTDYGGALAHVAGGYSSVFASNGRSLKSQADTVHAAPEDLRAGHVEGVFVNCTMTGNICGGVPFHGDDACTDYNAAKGFTFYNCVFYPFSEARYVTGSLLCYNCCQSYYGSLTQQKTYEKDGFNAYGNIGGDGYPRLQEDNLKFGRDQFVSGYGDWHLREGSVLLGKGSNEWITAEAARFVPREYLDSDYYGVERIQDKIVDMGAAEGGYPTGCVYRVTGELPCRANGCVVHEDFRGLRVSGAPGAELALDFETNGKPLYGVSTTNLLANERLDYYKNLVNFRRYYPDFMGTEVRLRVEHPSTAATVVLTAIGASSERWVDPSGSDDNPGTKELPFRTLAKAVEATPKYGVVYAKPGIYAEGRMESATDPDWPRSTSNRVSIARDMRLVGVEGAEKTVIAGEAAKRGFANRGCGEGALRCVGVSAGAFVQVQGFTLTGGHTDSDPVGKTLTYQQANHKEIKTGDTDDAYNWAGAGFVGDSYCVGRVMATLSDCIVSNNVAYRYSALCGGSVVRCLVTDNVTVDLAQETNKLNRVGGAVGMAAVVDSIVCDNDRVAGSVVNCPESVGRVYHTVFSERADHYPFDASARVYNSIFSDCAKLPASYIGSGNITNPPCAQTERGRFRIAAGSPAATAGRAENDDRWNYAWYRAGIDHVWPDLSASDGRIPAGPYQGLGRAGLRIPERSARGLSPSGVYPIEGRTTVALEASDTVRRFAGYGISGEFVPQESRRFEVCLDGKYVSPFLDGDDMTIIEPTYASDWYVDAANGRDTNDGLTLQTAKKTLAAALALALDGEFVYVAPGEYSEGSAKHSDVCWFNDGREGATVVTNRTRAVVADGVSLVSLEGAGRTIIKGFRKDGSESYPFYDQLGFGFSPESVRGVVLGRHSLLKGFTVKDCSLAVTGGGSFCDNHYGAGVLCRDSSSRVEDCVFELCDAGCGGGVYGGTVNRCRFVDCYAVFNGGAGAAGRFYNCFFDKIADAVLYKAGAIENCTVGPNNRYFRGSSGTRSNTVFPASVMPTNCLVLAATDPSATNAYLAAANCIFAYLDDPGQVRLPDGSSNRKFRQADLLAFYDASDNYAPVAGAPSIDGGSDAVLAAQSPYDAFGNIRIIDTIDIGAREFAGDLDEPFSVVIENGSRQIRGGVHYFTSGGTYTLFSSRAYEIDSDFVLEPNVTVIVSNGMVKGNVSVWNGPYDLTAYMRGISTKPVGATTVLKPELDPKNAALHRSLVPVLDNMKATDAFCVFLPDAIPGLWYRLLGADDLTMTNLQVDDGCLATGPISLKSPERAKPSRFFRTTVDTETRAAREREF